MGAFPLALGAELFTGKTACSSLLRTLWNEEPALNLQGRGGGGHVGRASGEAGVTVLMWAFVLLSFLQ